MKYLSALIFLSLFASCIKEKGEDSTPIIEQKKEVIVKDFGLVFNDYKVFLVSYVFMLYNMENKWSDFIHIFKVVEKY